MTQINAANFRIRKSGMSIIPTGNFLVVSKNVTDRIERAEKERQQRLIEECGSFDANTMLFFFYFGVVSVSFLYSLFDLLTTERDRKEKHFATFFGKCEEAKDVMSKALGSFLSNCKTKEEMNRCGIILDAALKDKVAGLMTKLSDRIYEIIEPFYTHGKDNKKGQNLARIVTACIVARRMLLMAKKVNSIGVGRWGESYPTFKSVLQVEQTDIAFALISEAYDIISSKIKTLDLSQSGDCVAIQQEIIKVVTDRNFYKDTCKRLNITE